MVRKKGMKKRRKKKTLNPAEEADGLDWALAINLDELGLNTK